MAFIPVKPGTLLAPVPAVLVTCQRENEKPNGITIAWAGTVNSEPPMCSISVRKERYSHDIIQESGEFVINLCGQSMLKGLDYCGVRSGRDEDKLAACGLHPVKAEGMQFAPALQEAPLYLACKVHSITPLGSHDMFIGRIVGMGVRDDMMEPNGRINLEKADLIAYNHGSYYALGQALSFFGHSVASPEVYKRRMKDLKKK